MERAIVEIDAALTTYARDHGGRFIRYGSTATGRMRQHSDVDLLADFGNLEASMRAADYAETACSDRGMTPDVRPMSSQRSAFVERAFAEGIVLG